MFIMHNTNHKSGIFIGFLSLITFILCISCSGPSIPANAEKANSLPAIFPDYIGVTIPSNLCPTNFMLPDCEEAVAQLSSGNLSFTYGDGNKIVIDEDEWAELCASAAGNKEEITVKVFGKKNGQWFSYYSFPIYVAKDTIDPYIAYRLIQPSYVTYEDISIVQRNITNFDESDIYNNQIIQTEANGQCINCHSFQDYGTDKMLFHMRQYCGGTMIANKGELKKVDLKTDSTISAGVYPSWNPKADLVAFSTNTTRQIFHTSDNAKIEVFDYESDLILYDVAKNEVSTICNGAKDLESFPTWSPDGKTLYYSSAHLDFLDSIDVRTEMKKHYKEIKYDIYSRSFDLTTHKFGEPQLIFDASSLGNSATLPRVSPDGRYLAFAIGEFGCFHVWHKDADICIIDLKQEGYPMLYTGTINSDESESYPSFSSNGRWIMTASRRDDGNYTRPYIAYFDTNGKLYKPFEVPQKNPEHNTLLLRSYNRPEFLKQKVQFNPQQFAEKAHEDALHAKYVSK